MDAEDSASESDLRARGWWASKALLPAFRMCGPCLPPPDSPESALMYHRMAERRPSDQLAYQYLQGRRQSAPPPAEPTVWWHDADLPSYVMQSASGWDKGYGCFDMGALSVLPPCCMYEF